MPIIQGTTIGGRFLTKAKWEVKSLSDLKEGQNIQVSIPVEDADLIAYMAKSGPKQECVMEKDGKKHWVILTTRVMQFKHMLEHESSELQSMVLVVPMNRTVESFLIYLLDREQSDPRFLSLIGQKP